ncbi:MAG: hypothetical protein ABSD85_15210 [Acidimicrobiales bacterium]
MLHEFGLKARNLDGGYQTYPRYPTVRTLAYRKLIVIVEGTARGMSTAVRLRRLAC